MPRDHVPERRNVNDARCSIALRAVSISPTSPTPSGDPPGAPQPAASAPRMESPGGSDVRFRAPAPPAQSCLWPRGRQGGAVAKGAATTAGRGTKSPPGLKAADQPLDPLVVRLEGILAEDGLALGVVELQVDPVDAVVLALEIGLADELATQPGPGGLGR